MLPYLHIFGLSIPMFGLMMLAGMVAAFLLMLYIRRFQPYNDDDLSSMAIVTIIAGFIGSKICYWLVELDTIIKDPHFLLESLRSGFVFYGALIGGCIGIWIFCLVKKQSFLAYADVVMPAFILGQGIGRIGCFCAGCCYGKHTDAWYGVNFPAGTAAAADNPCVPTQLFESAFCILFCIVLVLILRKQKRYGKTLGIYLIGYGVWRFFIEFFRDDDRGNIGPLSTSQFIGAFAILAGVVTLVLLVLGKTPVREDLDRAVKEKYAGIAKPETEETEEAAEDAADEKESGDAPEVTEAEEEKTETEPDEVPETAEAEEEKAEEEPAGTDEGTPEEKNE